MKKVVLAYSGGLDTSIIIPWLKENYQVEVIAVAGDVGQGKELSGLKEKALASGAAKVYVEDLTAEYVTAYIWPTLKAGAVYEKKYLLGTATARPCIAKRLAEIALSEGADAIVHGCTGKGNDQVRFELAFQALCPELPVIAPWRIWDIQSREEAIDYAKAHGIPVPVTKEDNYSKDRNIFHLSHEGMDLEDPWNAPKNALYEIAVAPEDAPDTPEYVSIDFQAGIPVALDGVAMDGVALLTALNTLGARHGVGIDDMVENRLVGMKSRGVYENPGGRILYTAHDELEHLCLDRETLHYKEQVASRYAELVYYGQWFSKLKKALDALVDVTQETVTGTVRMKLYKGSATAVGMKSPYSLYSEAFATFGKDEVYNQKDAEGFIRLFGLPLKVQAMMEKSRKTP